MPRFRGERLAFGAPGIPATWAPANKQGLGTAYSPQSRVWFTIAQGVLSEIFYPRIDTPQMRDLEFLFADGERLFLEEKRDLHHQVERIPNTQGHRVRSSDPEQRFTLTKEIIAAAHTDCILIRAELDGKPEILSAMQMYLLAAPHLRNGGSLNNAYVLEQSGRTLLAAEKDGRWLVIGASPDFTRLSCGYVGSSDGYSDLAAHHRMEFEFDRALQGNVALTGQLNLLSSSAVTVGLAFGENVETAVGNLFLGLSAGFKEESRRFVHQWETGVRKPAPLERASRDGGSLYQSSYALLLADEDKVHQGAFVASPSTPWGESRDDRKGRGGYHLVWTRDMVEVSMALLAAGDSHAPLRTLIHLASRQENDGSFPQNSWVDGTEFRKNLQLDEVAFPVLLGARLRREGLLKHFDVSALIRRAANFLLHSGPVTPQERWEEMSGYSPSTLATVIAAMVCAGELLRAEHEDVSAGIVEQYADYLVAHLEEWTVTSNGSLKPGIPRYFVRLNPAKSGEVAGPGAIDRVEMRMPDQPPGRPDVFPARDVIDAGFLQLVRYGIIAPDDPLIKDSLRVVDHVLMRRTPAGACWRRYNHDGYGQRPDGTPFENWGQGGAWPLLAGERGHYELAGGGDFHAMVATMERLSQPNFLLGEQVWDEEDRPEAGLFCGRPTGSAVPLVWAHAEYIRLLRSSIDGRVFDLIPAVAARYLTRKRQSSVEYWLPQHPIKVFRRGCLLRICAPEPFSVRWSKDHWNRFQDAESSSTAIGAEYCDLDAASIQGGVEFTLFWKTRQTWEGRNYTVDPD